MTSSLVKLDGRSELEFMREEVRELRVGLECIKDEAEFMSEFFKQQEHQNLELVHTLKTLERMIDYVMAFKTAQERAKG